PPPTYSPAPSGQFVSSFTLIYVDSYQPIRALHSFPTRRSSDLPTRNLNVRANTNPATVGSIVFVLSGAQTTNRTETSTPYALFGDRKSTRLNSSHLGSSYTVNSSKKNRSGGTGTAGTALTINFT